VSAPIVVDGVWKKFRRGEHHDSLRDLIPSIVKRALGRGNAQGLTGDEFWALSDVSFEVGAGEALGVIGPNGAGKSTLLKLMTRILRPDVGTYAVKGRIGALIEVAAGFHPDLTGRENIYLQGAILGLKREEIARRFDSIVDFAGIGAFLDTPVKRFSSGMNARLGFAIASTLEPDVLIIDEVLSVGDARFQARCLARMRELRARGVPLVFVSHNLPAVTDLCTKAVLLNAGKVVFSGGVAETVQRYGAQVSSSINPNRPDTGIRVTSVQLLDGSGSPTDVFASGAPAIIRVAYEATQPIPHPGFAVDIHRADQHYAFGISTWSDHQDLGIVTGRGHVDLEIARLALTAGCYQISVGIHRNGGIGAAGGPGLYDLLQLIYPFTVTSDSGELGVASLEHRWRYQPVRRPEAQVAPATAHAPASLRAAVAR
jgi:lipopolysaccharide transport system ATP-binding protein